MSDESNDDPLDEENHERIDRVRGKREGRRSRRRTTHTQDSEQGAQGQQAPQAQQDQQMHDAPQAGKDGEQSPQAQQAELEPVTNREHDTFYLSQEVRAELNQIYRRVSLNLLEETGVDIDAQEIGGRNRYFRPLALLVGARRLQEMSSEELRTALENEELVDDLPTEDS